VWAVAVVDRDEDVELGRNHAAIGVRTSVWRYPGFTAVGAAFVQLAERSARLRVAHAA
jgi:hypothetical protein